MFLAFLFAFQGVHCLLGFASGIKRLLYTLDELSVNNFLCLFIIYAAAAQYSAYAETAGRIKDGNIQLYASLHEAVAASDGRFSIDVPDEITLFSDFILDTPLIIDDGIHIRLVPANGSRTINRGYGNTEYPVIWVRGNGASLALGKPGMEHELIIDGGSLDSVIEANAPLIALSGPDAKLLMYDNVFLQNNYNNGDVSLSSFYENGGGVLIRTAGDLGDQQAEFIMKGGTIRGNTNAVQTYMAYGGAVQIVAYGIFTMEGGVIMGNTAHVTGGGVAVGGRGTFKKSGGIIYGKNAPLGFRNIALNGAGSPFRIFGHAVRAAPGGNEFYFRNNTVLENDFLTYTGTTKGSGAFGEGEKWDSSIKARWRILIIIMLATFTLGIPVFLLVMSSVQKRRIEKLLMQNPVQEVNIENMDMSPREKEICELLLSDLSIKQIGYALKLSYSGVYSHVQNLYRKLGIQSRAELFVKLGLGSKTKE